MRVLICGSRDWPETGWYGESIRSLLTGLWEENHREGNFRWEDGHVPLTIIEGCARGADRVACAWRNTDGRWNESLDRLIEHLHFPADWANNGRAAGPIRNRQMLAEGRPDVVYAFNYGARLTPGTKDMTEIAQAAGIPVFITFGAKL